MYSREENYAQKYSSDKTFTDENKKTGKERTIDGSEVDKTYWSDGSTTTHWGGPVGDSESDENGEEC
jgi:hypothetical protein